MTTAAELAAAIAGTPSPPAGIARGVLPVQRHFGVVLGMDPVGPSVSIRLAGSSVAISGVRYLASYTPQVEDVVIVEMCGPDLLVLGVLAGAPGSLDDRITAAQTRTSTAFGDLGTVGPTVTLRCGPIVYVSIYSRLVNAGGNVTVMGFAVSGATILAPSDAYAISSGQDERTGARWRLVVNPGINTFQGKYRVSGGTGTAGDRYLLVEQGS